MLNKNNLYKLGLRGEYVTTDSNIEIFLRKIMTIPPMKDVIDFRQACENLILTAYYFIYL